MVAETAEPITGPSHRKRNAFTQESSKKAIQARMKKSKETQAFIDSLKEEQISFDSPKFQDFIKENPTKRREAIREILERNLFIRLKHQHSLIASGDPLKKAEARKEDLGIGLEYDKLYKEQESEALTVRIPSALVGRLSGVLALKITPVDTSITTSQVENQNQQSDNNVIIIDKSYPNSVHS